jgi:coenzyme F420 hydrogenase subunit beta
VGIRLNTVVDVAERQLCLGCGACAYLDPARLRMVDATKQGRRPVAIGTGPTAGDAAARDALAVCPGADHTARHDLSAPGLIAELGPSWGPVLEMWEGHATDEATRHRASSGGAASALATYCIERGGMHGALHIAAREDVPYLNETVLSTSRAQIVERSGSRYAPASPCDGLQKVEDAPAPCVFIGKPCDCVAVGRTRRIRPALDAKLGLVIGIFCAGTPTTEGTLALLTRMGIEDPSKVKSLRYRGDGWPGQATAVVEVDGKLETRKVPYTEAWGEILVEHKQWRCNLCPDRTGETADVSVGDPWWGGVPDDAPGRSLVLVRTERGRRIVHEAVAAGYLVLEKAENWKLRASQPYFPPLRGSIWGRLLTLRVMFAPAPGCSGYSLFRHWVRDLSVMDRVKSFVGTARRVVSKRLRARRPVEELPGSRRAAGD